VIQEYSLSERTDKGQQPVSRDASKHAVLKSFSQKDGCKVAFLSTLDILPFPSQVFNSLAALLHPLSIHQKPSQSLGSTSPSKSVFETWVDRRSHSDASIKALSVSAQYRPRLHADPVENHSNHRVPGFLVVRVCLSIHFEEPCPRELLTE
jgi:hypothetical protein